MRTKSVPNVLGAALLATVLAGAAAADDAAALDAKPGAILVAGGGDRDHPLLYVWDGKADSPSALSTWRPHKSNILGALAAGRDGRLYYIGQTTDLHIYQVNKSGEKSIYKYRDHPVRDIALDDDENIYFSDCDSADDVGRIYMLRRANTGHAAPRLFCSTPIRALRPDPARAGFWGGNFAFGRTAQGGVDTNTLYLSTGNNRPGAIFRMTRNRDGWSKPERVFQAPAIYALTFTTPNTALYVADNQVFRLTDLNKAERVLTLRDAGWISSVSVVPEPSAKK